MISDTRLAGLAKGWPMTFGMVMKAEPNLRKRNPMVTSDRIKVTEIAGVDVYRLADVHSVVFQAGIEIDADGAGGLGAGAGLGDYAVVINRKTGALSYAICGDIGPRRKIGEASIAAAKAVGVPSSPRDGGVSAWQKRCCSATGGCSWHFCQI
jgi:hypothetical protein